MEGLGNAHRRHVKIFSFHSISYTAPKTCKALYQGLMSFSVQYVFITHFLSLIEEVAEAQRHE